MPLCINPASIYVLYNIDIINFCLGTFCPGTFCPRTFCPGTFCPGTFCPGTFCPGTFCPGHFVRGHFVRVPLGDVSEGQGECFYQDIKLMEERCQGRWHSNMMAEYC